MLLFENKKTNRKLLNRFLLIDKKSTTYEEITKLQSDIGISHETVVIAIAAVDDDYASTVFAKAMATTFALNKKRSLIIDANLFNPELANVLEIKVEEIEDNKKRSKRKIKPITYNKNIDLALFPDQTYPSEFYKSSALKDFIKESRRSYDHLIVIVPNLIEHDDVSIFTESIDCLLLLSQRNVTPKGQVFKALQKVEEYKLPLAKVVVIK